MLQIFLLLIAVGCAVQAASVPDLQKRHSYSPYSGYASYNSFYTAYFIYYATTPASSSCCWPIQKESCYRFTYGGSYAGCRCFKKVLSTCASQPAPAPAPAPTTTPTTTTTTPTTTTTTPTTTTTTPTTTTTTPTTTTTTPTTTTTTTTTPPTTTVATTTPQLLCPDGTGLYRKRRLSFEDKLLNGVALDECSGNGLVGWQNVLGGDTIALCNGVVTRVDPNSPEPLVILTDPTCLQILQAIKSDPAMSVYGSIYGQPIENFEYALDLDAATIQGDIAVIPPSPLGSFLFQGGQTDCEAVACTYNSATMASEIDFTNCYIASTGVTDQTGVSSPGGNMVPVVKGESCSGSSSGTECFIALDPTLEQGSCSSDSGAPVYCALSTGETVLYGLLKFSQLCDTNDPTFNVVPIN